MKMEERLFMSKMQETENLNLSSQRFCSILAMKKKKKKK